MIASEKRLSTSPSKLFFGIPFQLQTATPWFRAYSLFLDGTFGPFRETTTRPCSSGTVQVLSATLVAMRFVPEQGCGIEQKEDIVDELSPVEGSSSGLRERHRPMIHVRDSTS
jgi:hypothetical protein